MLRHVIGFSPSTHRSNEPSTASHMRFRFSRVGWFAIAVWVGCITASLFWLFHDHGFDDPYITYRYAAHLAQGLGFVYNSGEYVLSTTTPLYTMLLAVAQYSGIPIPIASMLIGSLSLALGGGALWGLGKTWHSPLVGLIGLLLYPSCWFLVNTLGSEMPLYTCFVLYSILACARERYVIASVLLAFATLTRADALLSLGALAAIPLLKRQHTIAWRALVLYGLLLVPWFLFAWVYFGSPFPITLATKQRQALMSNSLSFFSGLTLLAQEHWQNPASQLQLVFAVVGLPYVLFTKQRWLVVLLWNVLYIIGYCLLGVSSYFWYYAPLASGFVLLVGLGLASTHQMVQRSFGHRWAIGITAVLVSGLLAAQSVLLYQLHGLSDARLLVYREAGEWLRDYTPQDADVGALEVGIIGYYAERRMIDFAGLIQPSTALRLSATSTYDDAALWAVHMYRPNYLVFYEGSLPRLVSDPTVAQHCHPIRTFTAHPSSLMIYKCEWS